MILDKEENVACQSRKNPSRVRESFGNWLALTSSPKLERIRREEVGLGDIAVNPGAKTLPNTEVDADD